jgi:peptide-methionine (S)-S-oxide reductase
VKRLAALLLPLSLLAAACVDRASAEGVVLAPVPQVTAKETAGHQTAIFSGGCFWGVEGVFSHVRGVTSVVSGYRGGSRPNPGYEDVSTGTTGHAESVRVTYDPAKVRYDQLLQIFFSVATDPTELNYQGPDHGTQYRSALVPQNSEQRRVAEAYLAQMRASGVWKQPIVTRIEHAGPFYPAEGYHQDFIAKNPGNAYIQRFDLPKIEGLSRLFPALYKPDFTRG